MGKNIFALCYSILLVLNLSVNFLNCYANLSHYSAVNLRPKLTSLPSSLYIIHIVFDLQAKKP